MQFCRCCKFMHKRVSSFSDALVVIRYLWMDIERACEAGVHRSGAVSPAHAALHVQCCFMNVCTGFESVHMSAGSVEQPLYFICKLFHTSDGCTGILEHSENIYVRSKQGEPNLLLCARVIGISRTHFNERLNWTVEYSGWLSTWIQGLMWPALALVSHLFLESHDCLQIVAAIGRDHRQEWSIATMRQLIEWQSKEKPALISN